MKPTFWLSPFLSSFVVLSATAWCQPTQPVRQADFGGASLILLSGYKQTNLHGIDSICGQIDSETSKFAIFYDIGAMAGNYAEGQDKKTVTWSREQRINGSRARFLLVKNNGAGQLLVTFTDLNTKSSNGPANFSAPLTKQGDLADALLMFATFRWKPQK